MKIPVTVSYSKYSQSEEKQKPFLQTTILIEVKLWLVCPTTKIKYWRVQQLMLAVSHKSYLCPSLLVTEIFDKFHQEVQAKYCAFLHTV